MDKIFLRFFASFQIILALCSLLPVGVYGMENQSTGMDANSNIVVAWQENTLLGTEVKARAKLFSNPWETPVTLSTTLSAGLPIVAVVDNGSVSSAVAIWVEVIGGIAHLYGAMRPDLTLGWTPSVLISDGFEDLIGKYDLLLNSSGNIIATWTSFDGLSYNLRSSITTMNILNTWGAPATIN